MTDNAKITTHVSSDGTVYLRTQHGDTAAEIAEAVTPYIGRTMLADIPNQYGHSHRHWSELQAVDGEIVTLYVAAFDHTAKISAGDAFGTHCTMIDRRNGPRTGEKKKT